MIWRRSVKGYVPRYQFSMEVEKLLNHSLSIRKMKYNTFFISNCNVCKTLKNRGGSRGRGGGGVEGVATSPLESFQTCLVTHVYPFFHTKNNITSYIISSSLIDHYKKIVAISLLDSSIIQMQDWFSDGDHHARHLPCLVPSIIVNTALQLDRVKGMLFWEKDIPFLKSLGN